MEISKQEDQKNDQTDNKQNDNQQQSEVEIQERKIELEINDIPMDQIKQDQSQDINEESKSQINEVSQISSKFIQQSQQTRSGNKKQKGGSYGKQKKIIQNKQYQNENVEENYDYYQLNTMIPAQIPSNNIYIKQRFLYQPFQSLPNLQDCLQQLIEVRIHKSFLTKSNKAFQQRNFYGNENYTSDSDAVCIIHHIGAIQITEEEPKNFDALSVIFRVLKNRSNYPSAQRNNLRSRKIGQYDGHSIKFEKAEPLSNIGSYKELQELIRSLPTYQEKCQIRQSFKQQTKSRIFCQKLIDTPFKNVHQNIIFNLSLEPAYLYNLNLFYDKDYYNNQKLKSQVLYIETNQDRYEIYIQENQKLKFSLVKNPHYKDNEYMNKSQVPLVDCEEIESGLNWMDFIWGERSVIIKGKRYEPLINYKFCNFRIN